MDTQRELFQMGTDDRLELLDGFFRRQWMLCHVYYAPLEHITKIADLCGVMCETVIKYNDDHFNRHCEI